MKNEMSAKGRAAFGGKKILLVTRPISPPWDEASKNFAYFLAKNSDRKESEFCILTPGKIDSIEPHIKQLPIYSSASLSWFQRIRLLKLFFWSRKFDIVHLMMTPNRLNAFGFKLILFGSKAKTIQTIATLREDLFSEKEIRDGLFANLIITYSDHAKDKLESLGFGNVIRIYPGIDLEKYSPAPKDQQTLSKFKIQDSEFVIMYPGEYVRLGATDKIVESLPSLFEKIPQAKFVFGCRIKNEADRRKKESVVKLLESKKLLERVVFTDTFSDMPKLYNISDVVVFPVMDMKGKFDIPLAVIEAFACEKPVIISDLPTLQEFAKEGSSVIIKTGDFDQLIEKICDLYNDPHKRNSIGKSARNYARSNFDINNVASLYQDAYKKILQK